MDGWYGLLKKKGQFYKLPKDLCLPTLSLLCLGILPHQKSDVSKKNFIPLPHFFLPLRQINFRSIKNRDLTPQQFFGPPSNFFWTAKKNVGPLTKKKLDSVQEKKSGEKNPGPPNKIKMLDPLKKKNLDCKKKRKTSLDPFIKFFSLHGNGDTIGIDREIQCLP